MNKMKLSIITVNLNNKSGLQRTIDSVITQSFNDFEWIIIDGGSSDGSKELIQDYGNRISYWVSEPDRGIYNAMNKGIKVARGEYLLFLNSGDYFFDSDVLKKVFSNSLNEDIVYGYVARSLGGIVRILDGFITRDDISLIDLFYQTIPHQGSFIKRVLFDVFGLYDESLKICADRKFFIQSIIYGNASIKFIPLIVSFFTDGGISSTSNTYADEKKKLLNTLVPPRVYSVLQDAVSKREVCRLPFFSFLYSCLYRIAMLF